MPDITLSADDVSSAALAINVEMAALRAVIEVECGQAGFIADGRPTILYEAHIFQRETGGRFAGRTDRHGVPLSVANWDKALYGASGAHQWERLEDAAKLDWPAAHRSCSWGLGQVMGFNHVIAGWPDIQGFVAAMEESAGRQLDAMCGFLKSNKLDAPLRSHNWAAFAKGYNGAGYAANQYDKKLAAAYAKWSANPDGPPTTTRPTLRRGAKSEAVNELQDLLQVPWLAIDGDFGATTEAVVKAFQTAKRLTPDGVVGPATWSALDQQ